MLCQSPKVPDWILSSTCVELYRVRKTPSSASSIQHHLRADKDQCISLRLLSSRKRLRENGKGGEIKEHFSCETHTSVGVRFKGNIMLKSDYPLPSFFINLEYNYNQMPYLQH